MADILFLAHRVPYPPDRGDKIRSFHLLKHLAERHRVHLVTFAEGPDDLGHDAALGRFAASQTVVRRAKPHAVAAAQAILSGRPVSLCAFDNGRMRDAVRGVIKREPIGAVFVFSGQMAQHVPDGGPPLIMDFVDMDSAKFAGYAQAGRGPMQWMLAREARLLRTFEAQVAARAHASLFVSAAEAALFKRDTGAARVEVVENGIDTAGFAPDAPFERPGLGPVSIVFTGQMDYRPNIEGVTWFAQAVLPRIREARADAEFVIVGRNPTQAVQALGRSPGVRVTGAVADTRGWLAEAAVVVAPLLLARGIQNKVLEGMAMARPVVASAQAAEGIDHCGTIAVAAHATGMAAAIVQLLADRARATTLGSSARQQVTARYGWPAAMRALDRVMAPLFDTPVQERAA
ncbi:TIGR03087 family PEP-CTERM/XrtA system glycosyltransferase [Sphingomonas xinjiangensis]|uniref:Sugar transferase (PEP-CTERM/EpsH1 system associated) n=1 Tax=Sphingomonas xinjiangensis TaxID=643568 RepID=A0A840Y6F8_9SPHN|nr:TIGR03087 family PEP-CTERM/XrtA system glycosyltransferase [Sphingomonas xinjiangensis]MBB5708857.1 sugar transferase (PEP-CTERM/EpsH1 system associated) [Sphingomonas xinjiangensis]